MIEFKWEIKKYDNRQKFIYYNATWDGEWKNDPLASDGDPDIRPFGDSRTEDNSKNTGGIVALNAITSNICFMIESPDILSRHCGTTHPYWYRAHLFQTLDLLWD